MISEVISGESYVVVAWHVMSDVNANPGHTFYLRYRHIGEMILSFVACVIFCLFSVLSFILHGYAVAFSGVVLVVFFVKAEGTKNTTKQRK